MSKEYINHSYSDGLSWIFFLWAITSSHIKVWMSEKSIRRCQIKNSSFFCSSTLVLLHDLKRFSLSDQRNKREIAGYIQWDWHFSIRPKCDNWNLSQMHCPVPLETLVYTGAKGIRQWSNKMFNISISNNMARVAT